MSSDNTHPLPFVDPYLYQQSHYGGQDVFQSNMTEPLSTFVPTQVPMHTSTHSSPPDVPSETPAFNNASSVDPERTDDTATASASQRQENDELRNEVQALKSQLARMKRASEANSREEKEQKKRKIGGIDGLTEKQKKARRRLIKELRDEMKRLTGRGKSGGMRGVSMALDFKGTATSEKNKLLIRRAAKSVAETHKHPQTGQYELEGQTFTLADCVSFASTTFNSWKAADKIEGDLDRTRKNHKHQRKNRRYGRRVALSKKRMSVREKFNEAYFCTLPDEIFDPEFMTSCHSELNSSDVSSKDRVRDARDEHRGRMLDKVGISRYEDADVWELRQKEFRSRVLNRILAWLDECAYEIDMEQEPRRNTRPKTVKVTLDRKIKHAPAEGHRIFPFMVDTEWLRNNVEEGRKLEIEEKDPDEMSEYLWRN